MESSIRLIGATLVSILLAACSAGPAATLPVDSTPRSGGTLRFATIGEPPTLDMMATTLSISVDVTSNIYEGLFTLDSHFQPQPMLAQSFKTDDQGLRWVITLRKGVLFHNGQEMTSDDVIASLYRWGRMTSGGRTLFQNLSNLEAPDRYSIAIRLKKPMSIVTSLLSIRPGFAAIYPKSVIDAAGDGQLKEYIGTGPYKFGEWKRNQYIEIVRYGQYQARTEPADGMAGKREAYAEKIHFIPVPEAQQRVQGVETGLYDFATAITPDLYANTKKIPSIETMIVKPSFYIVFAFNKNQGLFCDLRMRQAVQAAADFQPMLQAAFGDPAFYRLDPSLNFKETKWWSDAGKAHYNQNNPAKAKQLLMAAGYRGQTVRILTTHEYDYMYKVAVVLRSQLEAIGMHASINAPDAAAASEHSKDSSAYDIYTTSFLNFNDPGATPYWDETSPLSGWWANPQKDFLLQQLAAESDDSNRLDLVSQFQKLWYEDVPLLKVGDGFTLRIWSRKVHGPGLTNSPLFYLYNNWLSK
jgi:peptide/nickel transport system substrate-binding protein